MIARGLLRSAFSTIGPTRLPTGRSRSSRSTRSRYHTDWNSAFRFQIHVVPDHVSRINAGHGADALVPSICWPYKGSAPLGRAQEHLRLNLHTLPQSACTVARIFGR